MSVEELAAFFLINDVKTLPKTDILLLNVQTHENTTVLTGFFSRKHFFLKYINIQFERLAFISSRSAKRHIVQIQISTYFLERSFLVAPS